MKFYNITVKKTYNNAAGKEVTKWLNVGSLRENDDGKKFIELSMFPEQTFYVFDQEPRQERSEEAPF